MLLSEHLFEYKNSFISESNLRPHKPKMTDDSVVKKTFSNDEHFRLVRRSFLQLANTNPKLNTHQH